MDQSGVIMTQCGKGIAAETRSGSNRRNFKRDCVSVKF